MIRDGYEEFKTAKTRGEFYTQDFESERRKPNFLTYQYCTRVRIITLWSSWGHKKEIVKILGYGEFKPLQQVFNLTTRMAS